MRRFVALVSWYHSVRADLPVACTLSQIEGRKWQFNVCGTSYADSSELRDCGQHCLVNESDEEKIEITLFRMMPPSARLDHPSVERHWNQSADDAYYSADAQRDLVYRIQGSNVSGAGEWTQIYNEAISVTLFPPHDQGPRRTFIAHMFYKTTEVEPSEPINVLRANSDCSFTQIGWYFGDIASPTARARQFGCFYAGVMGKHLSEGRNLAVGESTNRRAAQRTRGLFQDRDFRDMAFLQRPERSKYERYPSPTPQQVMLRQERAGPKNGRLSEADLGGMPVRRLVLRDGRNIGAPSEHTDDEIEGRAIAPNESAQNPLSEEPEAGDDEDPLVRVSMEESSPHDSQMMLDLTTMRELAAKINSGNYGWQAKVYPQFVRSTTTPFSLKFRQKLRASEARSDNATKRMDAGLARTRREDGSTKKKNQSLSFCHDTTFPRGPARGKDLPEACSWATLTGESVNQGSCGSCYAVSSVHMLQARYFKRILDKEFPDEITKGACDSMFDNPRVRKRLAELWNTHRLDYQDVIDNDGLNSPMNEGCNGGFPFLVLSWYKNTGRKVPFLGNQSRKSPSYAPPSVISMRYLGTHGYAPEATATCSHERRMMQRLVEHGPLTISLLWTGCMEAVTQLYQSGVIGASPDGSFMSDCQDAEAGWPKIGYRKTDHAVLLSGYGVDNGAEYWHVQNSWGHTWGEGGYFKMARNLYGIDLAVDGLVDQPVEMPQ